MISFLEGPFEDEMLISVLARTYSCIAGNPTEFSKHLFGRANIVAAYDFPWAIDSFVENLGRRNGLTSEAVIQLTTMYPLIAPFMESKGAANLLAAMRGQTGSTRSLVMWQKAADSDGKRHLRFCRLCIKIDASNRQRPWLRRSHQVPDVVCCHLHGIPLEISQFFQGNNWKLPYPLADDVQSIGQTVTPDYIDVAYAQNVSWLLNNPQEPFDTTCLRLLYTDKLAERGLIKSGQLRRSEFLIQFYAQRSDREWIERNLWFDNSNPQAWPAQTVKTRANHTSFRMHLYIMIFLKIPIWTLAVEIEKYKGKARAIIPNDAARKQWLETEICNKWPDTSWTTAALLEHLEITRGRMHRIAQKCDLAVPRLLDPARAGFMEKRRQKNRKILDAGLDKLSATERHRLVNWFARNDQPYYEAAVKPQQKRKTLVDWPQRERDYLARLDEVEAEIRAIVPFRRVCQAAFIDRLPYGPSIMPKLPKMQNLAAEIGRRTESALDFIIRKVTVTRQLNPDVSPSKLREMASVPRGLVNEKLSEALGE